MKKLLLLLPLTFLPVPASAITWNQFWRPFQGYGNPYYYHQVNRYTPVCTQRIYHREYVPPTHWRSGYTRTWSEVIQVSCYNH